MAAVEKGKDKARADGGGILWLDAEHACDVKVCILLPHDQGNASAQTPSIVYAPSSLLSSIPYFQTCLSEPWRKEGGNSQHEIALPCADSTSPADYSKCLLYCKSKVSDWMSVDDALRLLRAANHILFQDCEDYVMRYLACLPWSDEEDEIVQQTISDMGIKPNGDLSAKLTAVGHVKAFKEVLGSLIQLATTESEDTLFDFVRATFNDAPEHVANLCVSMIRDAWLGSTNDIIISYAPHLLTRWTILTMLLLEHGDTTTLLDDFVHVSKKFSKAIDTTVVCFSFSEILTQLLRCAIPSEFNKKVVLLSDFERARLLDAWMPWFGSPMGKSIESVLRGLFMSLPLQDPMVVAIVKEHMSNPLLGDWVMCWRSKLFKRMKRCHLVHEETDLDASNSMKFCTISLKSRVPEKRHWSMTKNRRKSRKADQD